MSAEHTSNSPHVGQAAHLYTELLEAKRLLANALAERDRLRKSAAAWDALIAVVGQVCDQDDPEDNPAVEPLLNKIIELRDVKAERDRLRDAARAFLSLLDRHQFSSVALRGPELDELREAVK